MVPQVANIKAVSVALLALHLLAYLPGTFAARCKTATVGSPSAICTDIANAAKINVDQLVQYNPGLNCDELQVGQKLCITAGNLASPGPRMNPDVSRIRLARAISEPAVKTWGEIADDGCQPGGKRKWWARLWSIPDGMDWRQACFSTPIVIRGKTYKQPNECDNQGFLGGEIGVWFVDDIVRSDPGTFKEYKRLDGVFSWNNTSESVNRSGGKRYDDGLLNPLEDLSLLSQSDFTTLQHPQFPRYSVRIKKSSTFCDPTVQSYTGYIDIEARHLFFYFFESRSNPDKDDVIFWTNGGPGGSSALGLFMELGPCRILEAGGPKFHPESWNSNANIFFIDQPVGVGFSYADFGEEVTNTEEAAKDIAAFVAIFFEHFTKFKGRPFHMAGESYGGRYIPVYASEIYDQNARLVDAGLTPINLVSIMLGNGYTDFATLMPSYYDMACTAASTAPVLSISTCMRMKQALPRCKQWIKESCIDKFDAIGCGAATTFCSQELEEPYFLANRNPYDITRECEGVLTETFCYPMTKHIGEYLSQLSIKEGLGVDPNINFTTVSWKVNAAFSKSMDQFHPTQFYVAALLERGVKALIYVGANDWSCNWIGNQKWTLDLEWSGSYEFRSQELKSWTVGSHVAGLTRSARGLTFVTIDGAGHMVPYDKPRESLELVNRWLSGEPI
ncbi:hypothetical protein CVT24_000832 [Panaeolus cyanescens]|uniref:Carboxypeptidase n=1 Tax=Panaeolus cyanescens TaxID=181874 RepID=A0A409VWS7_9AGAR|nr:hypothetical protein CVT24_000832 [Panaeolus cyanescens]